MVQWPDKTVLRVMDMRNNQNLSYRKIAAQVKMSIKQAQYIIYREKQGLYRETLANQVEDPIEYGTHLRPYKAVRRGFDISPADEPEYTRLLLKGKSCKQAAEIMGAA